MGVDVTPATGSDFTSRKSVVNIAPRHWRLGTTGICHTSGELCQLSFGNGAAGILRCRYTYRMGGAAARAADIRVLHVSRKPVNSKACIVIVESDDLIRELLERWLS